MTVKSDDGQVGEKWRFFNKFASDKGKKSAIKLFWAVLLVNQAADIF